MVNLKINYLISTKLNMFPCNNERLMYKLSNPRHYQFVPAYN